jgi:hypothetical protein
MVSLTPNVWASIDKSWSIIANRGPRWAPPLGLREKYGE